MHDYTLEDFKSCTTVRDTHKEMSFETVDPLKVSDLSVGDLVGLKTTNGINISVEIQKVDAQGLLDGTIVGFESEPKEFEPRAFEGEIGETITFRKENCKTIFFL